MSRRFQAHPMTAEQPAPRTEAGRRLLDAMRFHFPDERAEEWRKEIAAIEQEAARPSVCRHGIDREQLDCRQCEQELHRHVEVDIAEPERAEGDIAAYAAWRRDPKRVTADDVAAPTDDPVARAVMTSMDNPEECHHRVGEGWNCNQPKGHRGPHGVVYVGEDGWAAPDRPEPSLNELRQLRRIAAAAGRVSDAAIRRADLVGESTPLMMALGELDAELGKPLRRLSQPPDPATQENTDG